MGRNQKDKSDPDRYLVCRSSVYQYMRRVPIKLKEADGRGNFVRLSLKTTDLMIARVKRDELEAADNKLWSALSTNDATLAARVEYDKAVARADSLGYKYQTASNLAEHASDQELLSRMADLVKPSTNIAAADALIGVVDAPVVKMSQLLDIYVNEIAAQDIANKSVSQLRIWRNVKAKSIANFIEVVGDKTIEDVSRDDARQVYKFWQDRIAPKGSAPTHTASSGNRVVGNLRRMLNEYHQHFGRNDYVNPFANFSFKETDERTRPSFSNEWIVSKFLCKNALSGLNREARAIFLMMIDTGARPGELCNLRREHIKLDGEVPYIDISPVSAKADFSNRREIKTATSKRWVPLVGVSLEVAKAFPDGFPRYQDKESGWSAVVNKFLGNNGLKETPAHTAYGLRHSFEDRMKDAGVDFELRKLFMGHSIDREKYGIGGELMSRRDALAKIVLPFHPSIVSTVG